ncbi:MAG: radical SAM protein, partial [Candidatus Diapherotrites archaeon]|nr:radical SAM protein [Candidatus Diapherotrites archaeon]
RHLNIRDYFYSANLYPEVTIVTGRGCPFKCKFCYWTHVLNIGGYRTRSIGNVMEELEFIGSAFPEAKEIFLEDDTFTALPKRVHEFCEEKIKRKIDIRWSCNARADVPLQTLQVMKSAGCRLLCVGFESGSQGILDNVNKAMTIQKMEQFMRDTEKAGVLVHGCFMAGNEGETAGTIRETIELAKKLNPDTAQFFPIMVYPGTAAYDYFRGQGWLVTEDYSKWVDEKGWHNCVVSKPGLSSAQLVQWCDRARREFYLRPWYIFSKAMQVILHPEETGRVFRSAMVFSKSLLRGAEKCKVA